jgi:hypothetical protein
MNLETRLESALQQLSRIGAFPTDYTRDDLIRYVTVLEAQAYQDRQTIDQLRARIRELEGGQQQVS